MAMLAEHQLNICRLHDGTGKKANVMLRGICRVQILRREYFHSALHLSGLTQKVLKTFGHQILSRALRSWGRFRVRQR